ncbi:hypothetical protein M758_1G213400 [Ceratodon purpureus]|nr:hypothetical protein M758_1G213400 [Ceratodon purpureus]
MMSPFAGFSYTQTSPQRIFTSNLQKSDAPDCRYTPTSTHSNPLLRTSYKYHSQLAPAHSPPPIKHTTRTLKKKWHSAKKLPSTRRLPRHSTATTPPPPRNHTMRPLVHSKTTSQT